MAGKGSSGIDFSSDSHVDFFEDPGKGEDPRLWPDVTYIFDHHDAYKYLRVFLLHSRTEEVIDPKCLAQLFQDVCSQGVSSRHDSQCSASACSSSRFGPRSRETGRGEDVCLVQTLFHVVCAYCQLVGA